MTDERLNKSDAAAYLSQSVQVGPRTLDKWRAANVGPRSHKIGGRVFWLRSDLDQWLTAQLITTSRGGIG
jgi:predicted DNA-binding transcriptional regulator AlpA